MNGVDIIALQYCTRIRLLLASRMDVPEYGSYMPEPRLVRIRRLVRGPTACPGKNILFKINSCKLVGS